MLFILIFLEHVHGTNAEDPMTEQPEKPKNEKARRAWMFISAFGIVFAFLSWFHEAALAGDSILWKGPLALVLGFVLYWVFVDKV